MDLELCISRELKTIQVKAKARVKTSKKAYV